MRRQDIRWPRLSLVALRRFPVAAILLESQIRAEVATNFEPKQIDFLERKSGRPGGLPRLNLLVHGQASFLEPMNQPDAHAFRIGAEGQCAGTPHDSSAPTLTIRTQRITADHKVVSARRLVS